MANAVTQNGQPAATLPHATPSTGGRCSCICTCLSCLYSTIRFICCCWGCCCTAFWLLLLWALVAISVSLSDVDFDSLSDTCYHKLGVSPEATPKEIQKAFRKLALRYHPDKVAKDQQEEAQQIFQELSHCYDILNDETSRKHYDASGYRETNAFGIPFDGEINLKDIFNFFYENFEFEVNPNERSKSGPNKPRKQRQRSSRKEKTGKTRKSANKKQKEKHAHALKEHAISVSLEEIVDDTQQTIAVGEQQFIIEIPGGVPNGYVIEDSLNGYNWRVDVKAHDAANRWRREEDDSSDVYRNVTISMDDVLMSNQIDITMIDGSKQVIDLQEHDYRRELKFEQFGLKRFQTRRKYKNRGDAYVRLDVLYPNLDQKQKNELKKLLDEWMYSVPDRDELSLFNQNNYFFYFYFFTFFEFFANFLSVQLRTKSWSFGFLS